MKGRLWGLASLFMGLSWATWSGLIWDFERWLKGALEVGHFYGISV